MSSYSSTHTCVRPLVCSGANTPRPLDVFMGTYPSDNVSPRFCYVSASLPLFPPPCVRAHGSSGPGLSPPPRWLACDVAPFFFSSSQLCLLLLSHSRRLRSPLFVLLLRAAGCGSPRTEVLDRQNQPPGREEPDP